MKRIIVVVACIVLSISSVVTAQQPLWESLHGPYGGRVGFLATNASGEIYTVTYDMLLFRSTDEGLSWIQPGGIGSVVPGGEFMRAFIAPDSNLLLLAHNAEQSLESSTNNGITWLVDSAIGAQYVYAIGAISFSPSGTLLAIGKYDGKVFRSTDRAATWDSSAMLPVNVSHLTVDSSGIVYALFDTSGVYHSRDDGLHWESVNRGLPDSGICSIATEKSIAVIAASRSGNIYLSTDSGDDWVPRGSVNDYVNSLAASPNGDLIVTTDSLGLLRSTDLGNTWSRANLSSSNIGCLIVLPNGHYVNAHDFQVSVSTDNGETWFDRTSNMRGIRPASLAAVDGSVMMGSDFGAFARWDAASFAWNVSSLPQFIPVSDLFTVSSQSIWISSDEGLFQSNDTGFTWTYGDISSTRLFCRSSHNTMFITRGRAGDEQGELLRSTDNGISWTQQDIGNRILNSMVVGPNNILFAGTDRGYYDGYPGLLKSTDDGITWTAGVRQFVQVRAFDSSGVLYTSTITHGAYDSLANYTMYPDSLLRSSDFGTTWSCVDTAYLGPMVVNQHGDIFITGGNGYLQNKIKRSTDNGLTWSDFTDGIDSNGFGIQAIVLDSNGVLFCTTQYGGLYRTTHSTLDVRSPAVSSPLALGLEPNYPNPFTTTTTLQISFNANAESCATLRVYNTLGQVVREFVIKNSATLNFNANDLPGGTYSAVLEAGTNRIVREMVVVK